MKSKGRMVRKGKWHGSSGRALTQQVQSPEFKPQYYTHTKEKERERASKQVLMSRVLVAYACNHSYLGGRDWEDYGMRPAQIVGETPIFKNKQSKMDWSLTQAVECLLCKHEPLS
jgi:hypothetical protein